MPANSVFNSISKVKTKLKQPQKEIKKRHWFLASAALLIGSWITHTTTANIPSESPTKEALSNDEPKSTALEPLVLLSSGANRVYSFTDNNFDVRNGTSTHPLAFIDQAPSKIKENFKTLSYTVKKGDSLGLIFKKLSLNLALPYKVSQHETAKKLVSIIPGRQITFKLDENKNLRRIIYPQNTLQELTIELENNQISSAQVIDLPFQTKQQTVSGEISSSLYEAAIEVGMSNNIVMQMAQIFGWDIDFVLDIRAGDHFHVIYDSFMLNGERLSDGNILAAEFTTQGQTHRAIRFENKNGDSSYYTPEGKSMLGTFLRSPVEFSRISSRFGRRKHPILKKWRAHNGVDYAASRGTPIRSTADGKVALAGRKGGYGKTVVINHAGRFSTLYAHMNGFAKGIKSGSRVKQGQVIGYIGSTGLATGPHLHYEFRVDGVHRNSLTYKTPKASSIDKESKEDFLLIAKGFKQKLNSVEQSYQLTKSVSTSSKL